MREKTFVTVRLFGAAGEKTTTVRTRGGFPTRHIKVPYDPIPSIFSPLTEEELKGTPKETGTGSPQPPTPAPENNEFLSQEPKEPTPQEVKPSTDGQSPPTIVEIMRWMETDVKFRPRQWFILEEILRIATTDFGLKFNSGTLLDVFRGLFKQGFVEYKQNKWKQHMFRLQEGVR